MGSNKLVIIGQGYVGLPIAVRGVEVGFTVVGFDTNAERVESLNDAKSFIEDVTDEDLESAIATGRYAASSKPEAIADFQYAVITVPTPLKESVPDLSYVIDAAETIGSFITPGAVVVLESTTYPGTTDEVLVPLIEKLSGLKAGIDFYAGYSPERIDPGNKEFTFTSTPKVLSGINPASTAAASKLYEKLVDSVVIVSGTREAELTKLLENTFRHVNIALVNELAVYSHALGVDIWEAIDAAATKPFGFMRFTPGPGVGGHCLPIDPSYLSWQVRRSLGQNFRFVELANDVNDHMPDYVVQRLMFGLNSHTKALNGSTILLIGLSYKKNTGDPRESPAMRVAELLREHGSVVRAVDPYIQDYALPSGIELVELTEEVVNSADATVILTDHDNIDYSLIESAPGFVLDTRRRLGGRRESL